MNYNQKILERALREEMVKANITYNKYREILDVCVDALEEESEQASEPTQTGIRSGFRNFVQAKLKNSDKPSNLKAEPFIPMGATIRPEPAKRVVITNEDMVRHLENSGYTVTKTDEHAEKVNDIAHRVNAVYGIVEYLKPLIERIDSDQYIMKCGLGLKGVKPGEEKQANVNKELDDFPLTKRQLRQIETHVENMLGKKVMEMQHRLDMNYRHNTKDIADKVKNEIAKELKENRLKGGLK